MECFFCSASGKREEDPLSVMWRAYLDDRSTAQSGEPNREGGSLRDVQQLAGHSSLATTQRYIEGSSDAKRRIVDLIS